MLRPFALLFLTAQALANGAPAGEPARLVLNWKPEAEFGGFYAAQLGGHFKKENLLVKILPGGVGTPAVQMVASGRAEYAIASADEVLLARARGADVVALFAVYQKNPQTLLVREEHAARSLKDLFQGGTLAVQKGLPYFRFLEKKFGPVRAKTVPFLGGLSQLQSAPATGPLAMAVQGFETAEPVLAKAQGLAVRTFLVADAGFNPYATVVVTRQERVQSNPNEAQAFVRAVKAGWEDYLQSPEQANQRMHQLNPSMSLAVLAKSAEAQKPFIVTEQTRKHGLGSMQPSRWEELARQLVEVGLLAKPGEAAKALWPPAKAIVAPN